MKWTSPGDLKAQVKRIWERGLVLQSVLSDQLVFPKRLILNGPSSNDLAHAFTEVRSWCEALSSLQHVRLVFREVNHRVSGTNAYPAEAWLDGPKDVVSLLGMQREWQCFLEIVESTRQRRPELIPWITRRPFVALEAFNKWERLLDLVDWMVAHPRPARYVRQVDLPGIDTKFIEGHRSLIGELFDIVLPPSAIDPAFSGKTGFISRYGFREKPERIRFRVLDASCDPLQIGHHADLCLDVDSFAVLQCHPKNVFITENETNFLAFPDVAASWILFGAGYGFDSLRRVDWLHQSHILYWGDIDTHGFAVLDELRGVFPQAESFLMDRDTLLAHRVFWGSEPSPCKRLLSRLGEEEASLYSDLQCHRLAGLLRLEQERLSFAYVLKSLEVRGFRVER